jgi:hypothetical protein
MPARYVFERGAWQERRTCSLSAARIPSSSPSLFRAQRRRRPQRRSRGSAQDAAQLEVAAQGAARREERLLGERGRGAAPRCGGWIALGEGKTDEALKFMRAAADLEDKNEKHIVTPGRLIPARELLGDMLLETKQPALALSSSKPRSSGSPTAIRNYVGAARAAELSGNREKAASYYQKLLALAKDADTPRPELASAKQFASK